MWLTHRERLAQQPQLVDITTWPQITLSNIPKKKRKGYLQNRRIVELSLQGYPYREIQSLVGASPSKVSTLLTRCLAGEAEADPPLTQALIPGTHLYPSRRRMPLSSTAVPRGAKSSFRYLLDTVPGLRTNLDILLRADINDHPAAENLTPKAFHGHVLRFLDEAQHPHDQYPYTEPDVGYESSRRYLHQRKMELHLEKQARRQSHRVVSPSQLPFRFGREIQFDEQTYDAETTIYLQWSNGYIPLRVARLAVVIVVDVDTTCNLGFRMALTGHASQFDCLSALEACTTYQALTPLTTPGLHYLPGACFPANISETFARVAFDVVNQDNAWAHSAETMMQHVCDHHHGTIAEGFGGVPETRNVIERAIKLVSQHAKRFKSTSGKDVTDPIRESRKNRKKPPRIVLQEVEDAIRVILTTDNVTPKPHLMGATPLELCRHHLATEPVRLIPQATAATRRPFESRKRVTVRWLKKEDRKPHINFCYYRYTGNALCKPDIVGKEIEVRYDYRDIRVLRVHQLTGEYLGEVKAPKTWQRFSHGVKTRQYIFRYCRAARRRMKDPLGEFLWLQLLRKNKPRAALEIARLYAEYRAFPAWEPASRKGQSATSDDALATPVLPSPTVTEKQIEVSAWSPTFAYSWEKYDE